MAAPGVPGVHDDTCPNMTEYYNVTGDWENVTAELARTCSAYYSGDNCTDYQYDNETAYCHSFDHPFLQVTDYVYMWLDACFSACLANSLV